MLIDVLSIREVQHRVTAVTGTVGAAHRDSAQTFGQWRATPRRAMPALLSVPVLVAQTPRTNRQGKVGLAMHPVHARRSRGSGFARPATAMVLASGASALRQHNGSTLVKATLRRDQHRPRLAIPRLDWVAPPASKNRRGTGRLA